VAADRGRPSTGTADPPVPARPAGAVPDALSLSRVRSGRVGLDRLTDRQREVLALMALGRSNAWIARALFISEKAVVVHASNIYTALDLPPSADDHRRVLAVLRLLR
jgi:DNA-binding NarL/FixJ family response regulator